MIQIFLDGLPAIPKDGTSTKLTSENPFFTRTSTYTYEVEFPTDIAENRAIFGNMTRMDTTKEIRTMDAVLMADNITVLCGTAKMTSITEKSVKMQLLGDSAAYNNSTSGKSMYIDELDMGTWHTDVPSMKMGSTLLCPEDDGMNNDHILDHFIYADAVLIEQKYHNEVQMVLEEGQPWVAYPTINTTSGQRCNDIYFTETAEDSQMFIANYRRGETHGNIHGAWTELNSTSFCAQPFIWYMAELIARATGMTLRRADNAMYTDERLRRIFIANTSNSSRCKDSLPHWTVSEWWTNLETAFGLVLNADYANRRLLLSKRGKHYGEVAETVEIREVVEEFEVETDSDSSDDVSVSNVGWADIEASPYDVLPEEVRAAARYNDDFETVEEFSAWALSLDGLSRSQLKDTIFRCRDGHQFIYCLDVSGAFPGHKSEPGFVEVDTLRPRIINQENEDVDVELKFVPGTYRRTEYDFYRFKDIATQTGNGSVEACYALACPGVSKQVNPSERIDIEALLEDEEDLPGEQSKPDVIYMAIHDGKFRQGATKQIKKDGKITFSAVFYFPRPLLREQILITDRVRTLYPGPSLSLQPYADTLGAISTAGGVRMDTTTKHCIRFIADRIPDPGAVFLIRNRRFVCEKIEANITSKGLDRLLTGHFYEFDS